MITRFAVFEALAIAAMGSFAVDEMDCVIRLLKISITLKVVAVGTMFE